MRDRPEVRRLLDDIRWESVIAREYSGQESLPPAVLEALASVPREEFVSAAQRPWAYDNTPLPIGFGQTISQPYIVALMSALLEVGPDAVVLEVGTGSGYQAAVLSRLVTRVYSVEIVAHLGRQAARRLRRLGYDNVQVRVGDGALGWPEHAPYDGILVAAAADHIPAALTAQLRIGARLVIPLGDSRFAQQLLVVSRAADGSLQQRGVLPVMFVPLTGSEGDKDSD